ncbi:hypothetical protein EVA_10095 [gut metagenome]|uniref:Uncharacterized protein n=1 Tax=gut metagenome TaxID=749906 RepID=J9CNV4_9ZZZZ
MCSCWPRRWNAARYGSRCTSSRSMRVLRCIPTGWKRLFSRWDSVCLPDRM